MAHQGWAVEASTIDPRAIRTPALASAQRHERMLRRRPLSRVALSNRTLAGRDRFASADRRVPSPGSAPRVGRAATGTHVAPRKRARARGGDAFRVEAYMRCPAARGIDARSVLAVDLATVADKNDAELGPRRRGQLSRPSDKIAPRLCTGPTAPVKGSATTVRGSAVLSVSKAVTSCSGVSLPAALRMQARL